MTGDRGAGRRTPFIGEVVKKLPASSNKNSQTKIAPPIFHLVGLITADASFWTPFTKRL
ncbi:hypothetical protein HMPREF1372_00996 [Enterococcus faecium P1139]|nr:hypothetical protein HMPREF1372_00996 [Enterococcus faecium P1139]